MDKIIDALVNAGYYRARISTLSEFDKIIGGMAWAMQVFSHDINIDIFFTDTLDLGQKISLTERIVMVLIAMRCPYRIEPHQIVGLDYANLLTCIRWLLMRFEEVRREHEAFNRLLALRHYHRVTNTENCLDRSKWCYVVPVSFSQRLEHSTRAPNDSRFLVDLPKNETSHIADELYNRLQEKFEGNHSVSLVKLPSHFRAANFSSTNTDPKRCSNHLFHLDDQLETSEDEREALDIASSHVTGRYNDDPNITERLSERSDGEQKLLHKELDTELLATNQKIISLLKLLDAMPNELEINQYQRRYIELHQQLISKNKDVKKLFDLYNCLDGTKHYLMKEINLLDSIAANLDLTTDSATNRNSFMQQFHDIISRIQTVREDAQRRRDILRDRCEKLNKEYANLVD